MMVSGIHRYAYHRIFESFILLKIQNSMIFLGIIYVTIQNYLVFMYLWCGNRITITLCISYDVSASEKKKQHSVYDTHSTQYGSHMLHILRIYTFSDCFAIIPFFVRFTTFLYRYFSWRCAFLNLTCCMAVVRHESSSLNNKSEGDEWLKGKKPSNITFLLQATTKTIDNAYQAAATNSNNSL